MRTASFVCTAGFVALFASAGSAAGQPTVPTAIAWHSTRDGNAEIYIANGDGTLPTNLTEDDAADEDPAISPDGG
jgi:hypothetical protein